MIRLLVLFGAGLFIGLVFGFGLGRWLLPFRDDDEPEPGWQYEADSRELAGGIVAMPVIGPPGPLPEGICPGCDRPVALGEKWCQQCIDEANRMSGEELWDPAPGDRLYRWSRREPIRRNTQVTVIDWERVSWADRLALEQWDWAQRMHAWVEDWDRAELAAA